LKPNIVGGKMTKVLIQKGILNESDISQLSKKYKTFSENSEEVILEVPNEEVEEVLTLSGGLFEISE
jgi:hypothetical protein